MAKRIPQPTIKPFRYNGHGGTYPMHNRINRGYAVQTPDINPASHHANGRFINQLGETIEFYIEEFEASFEMAGTTGQSRTLRQFFPHNMVQPSVMVTGIAPNSKQYNKLAAFIRVAQHTALRGRAFRDLGVPFRNILDADGNSVMVPTIRFIITNGTEGHKFKIRNGRTIKGVHRPWKLEGYVKSMAAGATRFQQAPPFQFEFVIAESLSKPRHPNFGIWNDVAVTGSQLRSWANIFHHRDRSGFVGLDSRKASPPNIAGEDHVDNSDGPLHSPQGGTLAGT